MVFFLKSTRLNRFEADRKTCHLMQIDSVAVIARWQSDEIDSFELIQVKS